MTSTNQFEHKAVLSRASTATTNYILKIDLSLSLLCCFQKQFSRIVPNRDLKNFSIFFEFSNTATKDRSPRTSVGVSKENSELPPSVSRANSMNPDPTSKLVSHNSSSAPPKASTIVSQPSNYSSVSSSAGNRSEYVVGGDLIRRYLITTFFFVKKFSCRVFLNSFYSYVEYMKLSMHNIC